MKKTGSDKTETVRLMGPIIRILLIALIPLATWALGVFGMSGGASFHSFKLSVAFLVCPLLALSGMRLCYLTVKRARRRGLAILWTSVPFLIDLVYVLYVNGYGSEPLRCYFTERLDVLKAFTDILTFITVQPYVSVIFV